MRSVYRGQRIPLTGIFITPIGAPFNPPDVELRIYFGTTLAAGPFLYVAAQVTRVAEGAYQYTWDVPADEFLGVHTAQFSGTVAGDLIELSEEFDVVSSVTMALPPPTMAPSLRGIMRESPLYQVMGTGLTDRVFLIGHADGLEIGDPHRVVSVQETVNRLGADSGTPLLRAMLEAYYSGCRDIYLVAAAPMSEYVSDVANRNVEQPAWDGMTFYQRYHWRLQTVYDLLLEWDLPQIIVPVEASFYNAVAADFITQLATHCQQAFDNTGVVRIGFLGARTVLDDAVVEEMAADERLSVQGGAGKFVLLVAGEGTMNMRELPTIYAASVVTAAAGQLSTMRLDRGLCYLPLRNVINPTHADLTDVQVKTLAEAKINPLVRLTEGRRGSPFRTVLATDNTLGMDGSDFWSLVQVRLVAKVMDRVRAIARRFIGTSSYADFRAEVNDYLARLLSDGMFRDFDSYVRRSDTDRNKVLVDITLKPYVGVREITFTCEVGPQGA